MSTCTFVGGDAILLLGDRFREESIHNGTLVSIVSSRLFVGDSVNAIQTYDLRVKILELFRRDIAHKGTDVTVSPLDNVIVATFEYCRVDSYEYQSPSLAVLQQRYR